ncbi:MAG: hypothetical protein PW999_00615 [Paraburkholderia tropica]|nr:hypothetical protein [Paraburkholderia tropica]
MKKLFATLTAALLSTHIIGAIAQAQHNYVSKNGGGWYTYRNPIDGSKLDLSYSEQNGIHKFRLVPNGNASFAQEFTCTLPCNTITDMDGVKEQTSSEKMILPMVQDLLRGALSPS